MGALDELLGHWRSNPDAERTIALCSCLSYAERPELIREVGARAELWHARDAAVMLAVGRMYLDGRLLPEAQAALVTASKTAGSDPRPLRFLGEALLRSGDAQRAEKVLGRALDLGAAEEARQWQERARLYVALQRRVGAEAVAREVERSVPNEPSVPPPPNLEPEPSEPPIPRAGALFDPPTLPKAERSLPPLLAPPARKNAPPGRAPIAVPAPPRPARSPAPRPESAALANTSFQASPKPTPPPALASSSRTSSQGRVLDTLPDLDPASLDLDTKEDDRSATDARAPASVPVHPMKATAAWFAGIDTASGQAASEAPAGRDSPAPALVLEHLARVGVYEPARGVAVQWERPTRDRARGVVWLVLAILLLLGGGGSGWYYDQQAKQARLAQARDLNREVEQLLKTGRLDDLARTDEKLSLSLELDSYSRDAALLWLRNRVLHALLSTEEPRGIDGALHRARSLGIGDEALAFGKIIGFLAEADLAGGAAILPRWDAAAARDPYYQLAAGAVLEAAGDPRAIERFEAARRLDGELLIAHMLLAELALLELGSEKGGPLLDDVSRKLGSTAATKALRALGWALQPSRSPELGADARVSDDERRNLAAPLRLAARYADAVLALDQGRITDAKTAIRGALDLARGPAMASQLGLLAIRTGDAGLARKAALAAVRFNAAYVPARALAARVALLGGRIEEAENAVKDASGDSRDLAVARSIVAYELLRAAELDQAVEMLDAQREAPDLGALMMAAAVLRGSAYPAAPELETLAAPAVAWGDMVALDTALDVGDLEQAERLVAALRERGTDDRYKVRLARLMRYSGRLDDALRLSEEALERQTTLRALLERMHALFQAERYRDVERLLAERARALGSAQPWLEVWHLAATRGRVPAQKALTDRELPAPTDPLAVRIVAARALAEARDVRAARFITGLARVVRKHPDMLAAAQALRK